MQVRAVLRSEVIEKLLGKVLYEGIFEFVQRADLCARFCLSCTHHHLDKRGRYTSLAQSSCGSYVFSLLPDRILPR